jgi:hypothetical protein
MHLLARKPLFLLTIKTSLIDEAYATTEKHSTKLETESFLIRLNGKYPPVHITLINF